jgi:hypothetical protein
LAKSATAKLAARWLFRIELKPGFQQSLGDEIAKISQQILSDGRGSVAQCASTLWEQHHR